MRLLDIFKLSTRMFKARTSRTFLTILGMSVGIGAILFLVSLGYGLQKTLLERITTSESLLTLDVTESKSGIVSLNDDMVSEINQMNGVQEVSPSLQITAQGEVDKLSADMVIIGTVPSFLRLGGVEVDKGKTLSNDNKQGIVITSALADVLGKEVDELMDKEISFTYYLDKKKEDTEEPAEGLQGNQEIIKSEKKFKIIGTIQNDASMAYVHLDALRHLNQDNYFQIKVRCESDELMGGVRDQILEKGLIVSSLSETVEQANQIFKVVQIVLMLFGIIALIVSAIGMFNTMTITLLERTEEIGIMKSIGASGAGISIMFVMESTIMGFLGGVLGILIGLGGGEVFDFGVNLIARRFGGENVDLFFSPFWFIGSIVIFAGVVGFFTGIVPARRASKIDPLDALRYK